jgi:hypothetical protein
MLHKIAYFDFNEFTYFAYNMDKTVSAKVCWKKYTKIYTGVI